MSSQPVWLNDPSDPPFVYARCRFHLSGSAAAAHLRCASTGEYLLYVNGTEHLRGVHNSLSPEPVWQQAEIEASLVLGDNELLLLLRNGERGQTSWFMAEGTVVTDTGKRVGLGRRWKMQPAAAWGRSNMPEILVYDAQQDGVPHGPFQTDASTWSDAVDVTASRPPREWHPHSFELSEVFARTIQCAGEVQVGEALDFVEQPDSFEQCKFVQREGLLKPTGALTRIATGDGDRAVFMVLDFGRVLRGYPRLRLSAEAGNEIDLGWTQTPDGLCRWISYRCTSGYRDWCSPMLARFRYLVLRFSHCKMAMFINCISVMKRRHPPLGEGRFDSSGIGVGVWNVGAASLELSRSEVYEFADTAGDWSGVYAHALNDFYQTGDTRTTRATLECAAKPASEQQLAWLILVAQIHSWYSGETDTVRTVLSSLEKQLLEASERLLAAGHSAKVEEMDPTCLVMLAAACRAAVSIHRLTGSAEQGAPWSARADQLKEMLERFWSVEENLYRSFGGPEDNQLLNALILFFGLADDIRKADLIVGMRRIDSNGTTPLLTHFFEIGGFFEAGAVEPAMSGLEQHWSRLEDQHGATWAEKRNEDPGVCPGVDYFLGARILGITPKTPGYETLSIRPDAGGLDFATGLVNTLRGPVDVEWRHRREDHRFELYLRLDSDGETHICLPRGELRFPTVILNGETVWQNEKVRPNTLVRELISESNRITLVLAKSGRFQVELQ